jgi:hypothetical protein
MDPSSLMHKPTHLGTKYKNHLRAFSLQRKCKVHQTSAKAAHGYILTSAILLRGQRQGEGIRSDPCKSPPFQV